MRQEHQLPDLSPEGHTQKTASNLSVSLTNHKTFISTTVRNKVYKGIKNVVTSSLLDTSSSNYAVKALGHFDMTRKSKEIRKFQHSSDECFNKVAR